MIVRADGNISEAGKEYAKCVDMFFKDSKYFGVAAFNAAAVDLTIR